MRGVLIPFKRRRKRRRKKEEKKEAVILSAMRNVKIAVPDFFSISALTETFRTEFDGIDTSFIDISERPLITFSHPCAWRDMEQLEKLLLNQPMEGGTVDDAGGSAAGKGVSEGSCE
jgi:hypothetical protein